MCTEYMIITEEKLANVVTRVNVRMKAGWQPLGAPFMIQHPKGVQLPDNSVVSAVAAQAMVR